MIKVGVIGVGNMGKHHARNYFELPECELSAVCDLDQDKATQLSKKYFCKYYTDYKKMLEMEGLDAISLVVPTKDHAKIALDILERGIHLLIEKPIATTIEEGKKIVEKAKQKNCVLMIGHVERFNPGVLKLKQLLDEGKIGDVRSIVAKRVGVGGQTPPDNSVITDLAVHDIDIINYLLGKTPKKVFCLGGEALYVKRIDFAELLLDYDGSSGFIQVNWITPVKIRNLCITGTKGYIELDYISQQLVLYENNHKKEYNNFGEFLINFGTPNKVEIKVDREEPLKLELKSFINSVKNKTEPPVTGVDGLNVLRIALDAMENLNKIN